MKHYLKRRGLQALRLLLEPVLPVMGPRARARAAVRLNPRGKLYIPPELGIEGFFGALDASGTPHVVLRWFEELPHVARGHDVDILVSDDGMAQVAGLLRTWPRGHKIDAFSVTGAGGGGVRPDLIGDSVPGFPPKIAAEILASRRPGGGPWSIPAPREHLLGLAYHAVYIKGYQSGLAPDAGTPPRRTGSHDYAAVLRRLAPDAGLELPEEITLASLDRWLGELGWRPDPAHRAALAPLNRWLGEAR